MTKEELIKKIDKIAQNLEPIIAEFNSMKRLHVELQDILSDLESLPTEAADIEDDSEETEDDSNEEDK